jgi:DNA-binding beta-propeller fold protein YncE
LCLGAKRLLIVLTVAVILCPQYVSGQQPVVQKLTISQVQDLVSHGVPDSTMHTEILRRGLAFVPDPDTIELLRSRGAGPQTLAAIETFFGKASLSAMTGSDLLYMPSVQGLGLIEVSVAGKRIQRTAKTALFNNAFVTWNAKRREFYVAASNGDVVSVISADPFAEIVTMKGDVGWNTFSTALSPDGRSFYLVCFGGSPQTLRLVSFDTASRNHLLTEAIYSGGNGAYLTLSPDGGRLYVASGSHLTEYDALNLRLIRQQSFEGWQTAPLIASPDGRFLFTLQGDKLVRIRISSLSIENSSSLPEVVVKLSLSRDGRYVFASGSNAIYRLPLSLDSYTLIRTPHRVDQGIQFADSSDGKAIYALSGGNRDESLWVIDLATQQVIESIDGIAYPAGIIAVPNTLTQENR